MKIMENIFRELEDLEVVIRYVYEANFKNSLESLRSQKYSPANVRIIQNVFPSSKSMQQAFDQCNYKYLLVLDADQTLLPGAIETLYKEIKRNDEIFQIIGQVEYPWTNKLGWGPGLRNIELYRATVKKKFKDKLNFDDFLITLPNKKINKVICKEMFVSDHFQVFCTFRRLMKRIELRGKTCAGYLSHFLKAYQRTHSELYLVGLLGMALGINEIKDKENIDKANDASLLEKDKNIFQPIMQGLGFTNRSSVFPKVDFRQKRHLIWK